jgi:hypothetical protein
MARADHLRMVENPRRDAPMALRRWLHQQAAALAKLPPDGEEPPHVVAARGLAEAAARGYSRHVLREHERHLARALLRALARDDTAAPNWAKRR